MINKKQLLDLQVYNNLCDVPSHLQEDYFRLAISLAPMVKGNCDQCGLGLAFQFADLYDPGRCSGCTREHYSGVVPICDRLLNRRTKYCFDVVQLKSDYVPMSPGFVDKNDVFEVFGIFDRMIKDLPHEQFGMPTSPVMRNMLWKFNPVTVYVPGKEYNDDLVVLFFACFYIQYKFYESYPVETYLDAFSAILGKDSSFADSLLFLFKVTALARALPGYTDLKIEELLLTSYSAVFDKDTIVYLDAKIAEQYADVPLVLYTEVMEEIFSYPAPLLQTVREVAADFTVVENLVSASLALDFPDLNLLRDNVIDDVFHDLDSFVAKQQPITLSRSKQDWFGAVTQLEYLVGEAYHFVYLPDGEDYCPNRPPDTILGRVYVSTELVDDYPAAYFAVARVWAQERGVITTSEEKLMSYLTTMASYARNGEETRWLWGRQVFFHRFDRVHNRYTPELSNMRVRGKTVVVRRRKGEYINLDHFWFWKSRDHLGCRSPLVEHVIQGAPLHTKPPDLGLWDKDLPFHGQYHEFPQRWSVWDQVG